MSCEKAGQVQCDREVLTVSGLGKKGGKNVSEKVMKLCRMQWKGGKMVT